MKRSEEKPKLHIAVKIIVMLFILLYIYFVVGYPIDYFKLGEESTTIIIMLICGGIGLTVSKKYGMNINYGFTIPFFTGLIGLLIYYIYCRLKTPLKNESSNIRSSKHG